MLNSSKPNWYYEQQTLGFNYRMTDIHAAIGISQMKRLEYYLEKRLEIAQWYDQQFTNMPISPLIQKKSSNSSYHLYVIRVEAGEDQRDRLYKHLIDNGINANLHYIPIYRHPFFETNMRLKGAEKFYKSAVTLPIFPSMGKIDQEKVVEKIADFFKDE
jgi:dTDP-4-amino-4,6-dideoxygalactose transaminase